MKQKQEILRNFNDLKKHPFARELKAGIVAAKSIIDREIWGSIALFPCKKVISAVVLITKAKVGIVHRVHCNDPIIKHSF